jgi:hypothetical protein
MSGTLLLAGADFPTRLTEKGGAHKLAEDNLAGSGDKLFEESMGRFEK